MHLEYIGDYIKECEDMVLYIIFVIGNFVGGIGIWLVICFAKRTRMVL